MYNVHRNRVTALFIVQTTQSINRIQQFGNKMRIILISPSTDSCKTFDKGWNAFSNINPVFERCARSKLHINRIHYWEKRGCVERWGGWRAREKKFYRQCSSVTVKRLTRCNPCSPSSSPYRPFIRASLTRFDDR